MFYSIRHLTRFRYSAPVSESQMELRMHPRTEGGQRCLSFLLSVEPRTRLYSYRDYLGNNVHHFDVPGKHLELKIVAEALVEVDSPDYLPDSLGPSAWDDLDAQVAAGDYWEMLMPSQFARPTEMLSQLIESLSVRAIGLPEALVRSEPRALALFPEAVRGVLKILPFRGMLGLPVEILGGFLDPVAALPEVGIQIAWCAVLGVAVRWAWARGIVRYGAYGA